jgi:hypothetical protein
MVNSLVSVVGRAELAQDVADVLLTVSRLTTSSVWAQ